jgi:hypothetical protein
MQDDENDQYHSPQGYVYTPKMALELGAIWDGVDALERKGVPLDAIAYTLTLDWQAAVTMLAIARQWL